MKVILTIELIGFILLSLGAILESYNKFNKEYPSWDIVMYDYNPKIRARNHKISWLGVIIMIIGVVMFIWS